MLGIDVYAYLDDLIIGYKNRDNHHSNLEAVLFKLKEADLRAKLTKCEFLKAKITFLGQNGDGNKIQNMDDKISAIKTFHRPKLPKASVL